MTECRHYILVLSILDHDIDLLIDWLIDDIDINVFKHTVCREVLLL